MGWEWPTCQAYNSLHVRGFYIQPLANTAKFIIEFLIKKTDFLFWDLFACTCC